MLKSQIKQNLLNNEFFKKHQYLLPMQNILSSRKLFVTTALPYANGALHIGHIMEYIQADIWVRFQRMHGHEVHFVCADDAHGAAIMIAAEKAGISPKEFISNISTKRKQYLDGFHIKFDNWHSTDSPENQILTQQIYLALRDEAKLITTKKVDQFFDLIKNIFLPDRYIKGCCPKCNAQDQYGDVCENCGAVYTPIDLKNPYSILSGTTPIIKSSEHLFFQLSDPKCTAFLQKWINDENHLQPEIRNKAKEWLENTNIKNKLKDWDISRDAPYFGIKIPDTKNKYFYVWLDAPIGYLASLKNYFDKTNRNYHKFMCDKKTEQYHFIGKDITYFHTIFWPAILQFSGLKVPTKIFVHGFMTINGQKMSKSKNIIISPLHYLKIGMNPEWLRYYIATKLNAKIQDIDFNLTDFISRINSDLIGKYINIASRSAGFLTNRFNSNILFNPEICQDTFLTNLKNLSNHISTLYDNLEYGKALRLIMQSINKTNAYIELHKPWELAKNIAKQEELHYICSTLLEIFRIFTIYLKPILPKLAEQVEVFLNVPPFKWRDINHSLTNGHKINTYTHLMKRINKNLLDQLFKKDIST